MFTCTNMGLHKPKAKWTRDEDDILLQTVSNHGARNWNVIAESLPGRTGKQCRERYLFKFSQDYKQDAWTPEEDRILRDLQSRHGNHWSRFQADLPGRSTVAIKNRWTSLKRRDATSSAPSSPPLVVVDTVIAAEPDDAEFRDIDVGVLGVPYDDLVFGDSFFDYF